MSSIDANRQRALYVHDMLNKLTADDCGGAGFGMSFVKKKKKLFYSGTFALLTLTCIHHGIFNMLVQTEETKYFGFVLPMLIYLPAIFNKYVYPRILAAKQKSA